MGLARLLTGLALGTAVLASSSGPLPRDASGQQKVSYHGFQVVRVPVTENDQGTIHRAIEDLGLATWQDSRKTGRFADIVVPPDQTAEFAARLGGIDTKTLHHNLGAAMAEESNYEEYEAGSANRSWFRSFHPYQDHMQFLYDLHKKYPNHSEIVTSGTSLQGRNMTGLRIFGSNSSRSSRSSRSRSAATKKPPPAVVFHGTVHAREWIATMVVEYLAYQLLTGYASSSSAESTRRFVDRYDVYAFPVVNPDGFVYTQTTDRLWRKNRQDTGNASCVGRDINRNWPVFWSAAGGASTNPCAPDYRGGGPADAPETAALTSWLQATQDAQGIQLYIDYHSYGQLFMTPYGYTCAPAPAPAPALQAGTGPTLTHLALAEGAAEAIYATHGVYFQSGSICSMLYKSTGNSVDYVHDVVGAAYSFTSELRDMGQTGFVLPPAQIEPSCEEAFAGVRYLLENME